MKKVEPHRATLPQLAVPLTGLEPVLSALRGQRVNHLHHSGRQCGSRPDDSVRRGKDQTKLQYTHPYGHWQSANPSGRSLCRAAGVLIKFISFFIKFHIEKMQIRFALFGDEWLYIKLRASPVIVALSWFGEYCAFG